MTNEELVIQIRAGENVRENEAQLWDQCKYFVRSIVSRFSKNDKNVELEDLMHEGYFALHKALYQYDPKHGEKFLTYAFSWIHGNVCQYANRNKNDLCLSVQLWQKVRKYEQFLFDFMMEYARKPTVDETIDHIGLTRRQLKNLQTVINQRFLISLDEPIGLDGGVEEVVGTYVPDENENVEETVINQLETERLTAELWNCVSHLPEQQAKAIRLRFGGNGMTVKNVAYEMNLSYYRAEYLIKKGLRILEKNDQVRQMKQEMDIM